MVKKKKVDTYTYGVKRRMSSKNQSDIYRVWEYQLKQAGFHLSTEITGCGLNKVFNDLGLMNVAALCEETGFNRQQVWRAITDNGRLTMTQAEKPRRDRGSPPVSRSPVQLYPSLPWERSSQGVGLLRSAR